MSRCRSQLLGVIATLLAVSVCACGTDDNEGSTPPPRFAVLSAFPGEMAAVLEHATIESTMMIDGRTFRLGTLGGARVVIGLTGIGLVNAATTTHAVLEKFAVAGVVVSAVAGSTLEIGDVTVPASWQFKDGTTYTAHQPWLDLANTIAAAGTVSLQNCIDIPSAAQEPVCLLGQPAIVVGGVGQSTDPFQGMAFPCQPNGGDVYGCDVASSGNTSTSTGNHRALRAFTTAASEPPIANDMETAAIAREAAAHGLPFIAFRAVSDGGPGDPLNLGFLDQFVAYYPLAAHNAAAMTVAFLEHLAAGK